MGHDCTLAVPSQAQAFFFCAKFMHSKTCLLLRECHSAKHYTYVSSVLGGPEGENFSLSSTTQCVTVFAQPCSLTVSGLNDQPSRSASGQGIY